MDENKIISLENLNQYSDETSDKIKSYVDTKTSVIQDGTKTVGGVTAEDYNNFKGAYDDKHTHTNKSVLDEISEKTLNGGAELSGSTGYTVTDSVEYPLVGLKVFGKSTQDGTPTPENPVEIVSVVEPTITVNNDTNNVSLPLQYTLNAIPVSSGGNVTIDGQEYIADYVDFERGVKVQKVGVATIDGSELWHNTGGKIPYCSPNTKWSSHDIKLSNDFRVISKYHNVIKLDLNYLNIQLDSPFEDYQTWVQNNPFDIYFVLATPIETPLSESELQAYRQLHTYNGVTNISNDKGAGLSVEYCTSKMLAEYALPLIKDLEAENAKKDEEISALKTDILTSEKIHNRIYEGINLAEKFASEIAAEPYNGDVWAWIKARIIAENFTGIRVGDYIPFTTTNGVTLNAQIAGINTYKNYGDTPIGSHIDFICKELWGTLHPVNKVNYNNGTESQNHPWLASDLYLYLNSLSGSVPNSETVNPEMVDVDYTADGVYYYLPEALKNVIKEKRLLLPKRYSASGLLTDDNQWGWTNIGKLWLPDECEVYGTPIWGKRGFSAGGSGLQYPLFAGNMNRLKFRNGSRGNWWLLSPHSSSSSSWCYVANQGGCSSDSVSSGYIAAPVCFRV